LSARTIPHVPSAREMIHKRASGKLVGSVPTDLTSEHSRGTIRIRVGAMAQSATPVQLKEQTLKDSSAYILEAESVMERTLSDVGSFLWSDINSKIAQQVRGGQVVAQFWSGHGPVKVPNGLIRDWIGASFTPKTTVKDVLTLVQDYDNHRNIYKPEVIASRLISHRGSDFQIYLRQLKKKIISGA